MSEPEKSDSSEVSSGGKNQRESIGGMRPVEKTPFSMHVRRKPEPQTVTATSKNTGIRRGSETDPETPRACPLVCLNKYTATEFYSPTVVPTISTPGPCSQQGPGTPKL